MWSMVFTMMPLHFPDLQVLEENVLSILSHIHYENQVNLRGTIRRFKKAQMELGEPEGVKKSLVSIERRQYNHLVRK